MPVASAPFARSRSIAHGDFVRIKATEARVVVMGHEVDRGTVAYGVAYPAGAEEGGFLVKELERVE